MHSLRRNRLAQDTDKQVEELSDARSRELHCLVVADLPGAPFEVVLGLELAQWLEVLFEQVVLLLEVLERFDHAAHLLVRIQ